MPNTPVFGKLGQPRINSEAGIIDFPVTGWDFTDAKARVIAEEVIPDLKRHTRGGSYTAIKTNRAPGCVRLFWDPHEEGRPMPSQATMERHAASFVNLFTKQHYRDKMRRALPKIEAAMAAVSERTSWIVLERQLQGMNSSSDPFVHTDDSY